jgi:hypothetical protein
MACAFCFGQVSDICVMLARGPRGLACLAKCREAKRAKSSMRVCPYEYTGTTLTTWSTNDRSQRLSSYC